MSKGQAIILAGGKGSRLRPYTTVLPKPLIPLGDHPIMEIIIQQLKKAGFTDIVISTGHLASLIETYFGDGKRFGVNIRYVKEKKPLGTAGALKLVKNLQNDFLVINGDVLTNINYSQLLKWHKKKKSIATITVVERRVKTDFGVIETNTRSELMDYIEKPEHKSFVSMGLYALNKDSLKYIKKDESIGMPDFMLRIKKDKKTVFCHKTKATWFDLGRLDDLESAQEVFLNNKNKFL